MAQGHDRLHRDHEHHVGLGIRAVSLPETPSEMKSYSRTVWKRSEGWLKSAIGEKTYREKIQPVLKTVAVPSISSALSISEPYATGIRNGKRLPHPQHWQALARIVGVSQAD
jgi:hypothetical protein